MFHSSYLLFIAPGIILAIWASIKVKMTFSRYSKVGIASGLSGAEVARELLDRAGIGGVRVEPHRGWLSDHYHPTDKVVRLSPQVYEGRSVAAVGVAAHEVGHAIQHAEKYAPMRLRQSLVAPANLGSSLVWILIVLGMMMRSVGLIWAGVLLFSAVVLFQIVTLPVELNASRRAKARLVETGIISGEEAVHVGKMLSAAAMTYIAALITAILQLVYLFGLANRR